ncbi:MAG: glycosyltransferase family 39 protein, partial [Caldilineaceae bacterium]|nr:glycosyltransferase family 39 protein [Caldilineaceae bacterium]
ASLRYESYQPPLYYLLGAIVYRVSAGSLLGVRLLNVLLGLGVLLLLYFTLEMVFPDKPMIVIGATAFTAFLPMHVAVTAAVTNDVLAELLVIAQLTTLLTWMRGQLHHRQHDSLSERDRNEIEGGGAPLPERDSLYTRQPAMLLLLGLLLGLGLLTKIYTYAMVPLCVLAIISITWLQERHWRGLRRGLSDSVYMVVPAILLGLPWWLRSTRLYGPWDFLGLRWHDQVVAGQPTTSEWIAQYGFVPYSERAFSLTFQSFWGVFGWLGVFMDQRIYTALLIGSGVLFLGLLWSLIRLISGRPDTDLDDYQRSVLVVFALMVAVVTASYIWYNTKFVQHQGRYFFWGILPISTFVALGWREVMRPLQGTITGILATILAVALAFTGYVGGSLNKWTILTIGLFALPLLLQPLLFIGYDGYTLLWLPTSMQKLLARHPVARVSQFLRLAVWLAPYLLLVLLNLLIPTLYLLPQLARHR